MKHTDSILVASYFLLRVKHSLKNKLMIEPQSLECVDNCHFIHTIVFHLERKLVCFWNIVLYVLYSRTIEKNSNTGWGKITSINFKVNNKKTIHRYKNFIFGFWNYNMGSFKSHSLKKNILQVVAVVCVQSTWETAKRTVWQPRCSLVFERSVVVLIFFQTHFPFPWSS